MTVSIIICTRNRADSLKSTLESIGKMTVPEEWSAELLVVDNGSVDHTPAVVSEARLDHVDLRYVSEPKPGQCHARNAGLRAATGEIILFTDDDIRVPSTWVTAMCRPILSGEADAVAGAVVFPAEYDEVLSRPALSVRRGWFASTEDVNPSGPARMVGANMAFHRNVLSKVSDFDIELGPGAQGFGDDTLFSFRLLAEGFKLTGVFDTPVEHHFDLSRLTTAGLLDLARKMGRSHAFLYHHWEHKSSRLALPRLMFCHLRRFWRRRIQRGQGGAGNMPSSGDLKLAEDFGFYREYLAQRRRPFKY